MPDKIVVGLVSRTFFNMPLWIGLENGYFAHLERMMREEFRVGDVVWRTKKNFSAPATPDIVDEIKRWQVVVTGIGD